jgi:transposase-like protein
VPNSQPQTGHSIFRNLTKSGPRHTVCPLFSLYTVGKLLKALAGPRVLILVMARKLQQPKTLQQAIRYFTDEQVCIDAVAAMRWPDGKPTCPACGGQEHYYLATQKRWKCKECWKQFTVKLGTIFEDSALPLSKWLPALWLIVNCKNGISSYELGKDLGVSQKSAWFMLHRLRLALQTGFTGKIGGSGSEVEADETFVGGKMENMHKSRRVNIHRIRSNYSNAVHFSHLGKTAEKVYDTKTCTVMLYALQLASCNLKRLEEERLREAEPPAPESREDLADTMLRRLRLLDPVIEEGPEPPV